MPWVPITRWRWRLRGAWQWPTFAVSVVGEMVLLHLAPISGESTDLAGSALLAWSLNLFVLAVLAPVAAVALRRRRADLPRAIARDYCGSVAMLALAILLVVLAVRHHPAIRDAERAFQAQSDAARLYVHLHGAAEYQARIDAADTWRLDSGLYRTCVPGTDPQRSLCLIINVALSPPGITVDRNRAPNSTYVGPEAIGRGHA